MSQNNFEIYDFDKKNLPIKKFDMIISLYSLDYHYDFKIYEDYFRESVRFWPMSSVDDNVKRKLPPLMPGLEELLINKPTPVPT